MADVFMLQTGGEINFDSDEEVDMEGLTRDKRTNVSTDSLHVQPPSPRPPRTTRYNRDSVVFSVRHGLPGS